MSEDKATWTTVPTHIMRTTEGRFVGLCGHRAGELGCAPRNFITFREYFQLPLKESQEVVLCGNELTTYKETICQDCLSHPDLPLLLLGEV